jgi:sterol 3beta-glucosyltransferase
VPGFPNKSSHQLANVLIWRAFRHATNKARTAVCGLPVRRSNWTTHPMLYGISPSLLRPADRPVLTFMCDQWTARA